MKNAIIILLSLTGLAASCRTRKPKITDKPRTFDTTVFATAKSGKDSLLRKNWEYFSGRLAVDYYSPDQELSANVSLRMKKDSLIWFSVTASLGIQVAKGIITRDSILLLNLIEKTYSVYNIKQLGNTFGAELSLLNLQNMIIGNPVFDTVTYSKGADPNSWIGSVLPVSNIHYAADFKSPDSSFLFEKGNTRQLKTTYFGSKSAGSYAVSEKMKILSFSASKTVRIDIEFTTASDAVIPSYPFSVPSDYKRNSE